MKEFKKIAIAVVGTVLSFVVLDFVGGLVCDKLYHDAKYSLFARQNYVLNESADDIIILGSSRASHHYIPSILTDSLGLSCFNAGSDGMCIYYHYGLLSAMIERGHKPKMVIYEVMPTDIQKSMGATFTLEAALDRFAPHYGEFASIDSLFAMQGLKEHLKLYCKLYRYNSQMVQLINCRFLPKAECRGYERLDGVVSGCDNIESNYNADIEEQKLEYFDKLISLVKENNIELVMVYSPIYGKYSSKGINKAKIITKNKNIAFVDLSAESEMIAARYFRDTEHLNHQGAILFTQKLAKILKSYKQNKAQ